MRVSFTAKGFSSSGGSCEPRLLEWLEDDGRPGLVVAPALHVDAPVPVLLGWEVVLAVGRRQGEEGMGEARRERQEVLCRVVAAYGLCVVVAVGDGEEELLLS